MNGKTASAWQEKPAWAALFLIFASCVLAMAVAPAAYAAGNGEPGATANSTAAADGEGARAHAKTAALTTVSLADNKAKPARISTQAAGAFTIKARIKAKGAANTVKSLEVEGTHYLLLPSYANLESLPLVNGKTGKPILVSERKNGSYREVSLKKPLDLRTFKKNASGFYQVHVKAAKGQAPFTLSVMRSANVRTLYITSRNPKKNRAWIEASKDHSREATGDMTLVMPDGTLVHKGKLDQIRGRGNSTWKLKGKKPYQIKLDEKASLLDGSKENAAKTWVLLANAIDDTLVRNYIAYKTSKALGMEGAPDCEFVDLYYDGSYRGNYLLCEKVQVKAGRVDIAEQENESTDGTPIEQHKTGTAKNKYGMKFKYVKGVKTPKNITGGYLIELDNGYYKDERCWFKTSIGYFTVKSPENASKKQVEYISEFVQKTINELKGGKNSRHIDMKSLAQSFAVNEMAKNSDYMRWSSTYFYKDRNGVLYAGPVWDFDSGFGMHKRQAGVDYIKPSGWASERAGRFFLNNGYFKRQLKAVCESALLPAMKKLTGKGGASSVSPIAQTKKEIAKSVKMERVVHKTAHISFRVKKFTSWSKSLSYTTSWLIKRTGWIAKKVASF